MSESASLAAVGLDTKLERALQRLEAASSFAKHTRQSAVLDLARRMMLAPEGLDHLYALAPRMEAAGLFSGTDWDQPESLRPRLVSATLGGGDKRTIVLESLSELRLLAIARGELLRPGFAPEQARIFLTQVLALNLHRLFGARDETTRIREGGLADAIDGLFQYLLSHIGYRDILGSLVNEIWRILAQRPVQVHDVKAMVTRISVALGEGVGDLGQTRLGADRLVGALFNPTQGSIDDPGLELYEKRIAAMDAQSLQNEATGFARAMHDVGLVSDYHAFFLRWLQENDHRTLIPDALGLGRTGLDSLRLHRPLVSRLITDAVHPGTAQAVYGLSCMLERGILHHPAIAPSLWQQIHLQPSPHTEALLTAAVAGPHPPRVHLLAGVINILGQPLGVGQGNNPTCQAARAISLWALNDPSYLLHLIAEAATHDRIVMPFEGTAIDSGQVAAVRPRSLVLDVDPASMVLVPHLDAVYAEMGRLCADRGGDPHRWINTEYHGWWVGRVFRIAVDVPTGKLTDYRAFVHDFIASHHLHHNGDQPLIHPQPAGLAVTDANGGFVGWHAITLLRVAEDQQGVMRIYFYNPNNDSGQDWGHGVVVSTHGNGERFGEASLPFTQLLSRLYIFHDDTESPTADPPVPDTLIDEVIAMAQQSWAAERL